MSHTISAASYVRATHVIPGGVNSPVRAFKGVGGTPIFFQRGQGPLLFDLDDNQYIDYVSSWGPLIQGYGFQPVLDAIHKQADLATSFGAPTLVETKLAECVVDRTPSIDKVRMCNSGTEATMSAIRLARGITGRDKIVKFQGCFHGHGDSLLVKAGSGVLTLGLPDSPGVPKDLAQHTITLPYNDVGAVHELFDSIGSQIAGVIVEPIAGNMGCIPPRSGFLEALRDETRDSGSLLIFDEVMTGFRVDRGGAQSLYNVDPDLTTLGKIIGAGLPVGAFGGKAEYMDQLAPLGSIYQSGTLSGNPLAMAAGLALLESLDDDFYRSLDRKTTQMTEGIRHIADQLTVDLVINKACGMFSLFFTDQSDVESYADVESCDADLYAKFFHHLLEQGVYFAPSAFESAFVGGSHTDQVISDTLDAIANTFSFLQA